jgi:outer membrane protein OmpA-like peptidoglycan-associated protein
MTQTLSRWQTIVVGILVVIGASGAAYGLFAVGDRQRLWSETFTVHVGFDRVQGVGIGTPVRVRGLEAGVVTAIDLPRADRTDAPLVLKLELDRRYAHLLHADAFARIRSEGMVGAKVIELEPGTPSLGTLADNAVIASKPAADFNEVVDQAAALVNDVKNGQGSLGKLIKDDKVYTEVAGTLEQTRQLMQRSQDAVSAIQQDAEAIKKLPIVRGYVEDTTNLIVRHVGTRHRKVIPTSDLFEPSRAVLTDDGKAKLTELANWFDEHKVKNSDVVVVVYTDAKETLNSAVAHTMTLRQAEAVVQHLRDQMKVHKLGWFSSRNVTPIGCGLKPPPVAETEPLPPSRVEILVFTP